MSACLLADVGPAAIRRKQVDQSDGSRLRTSGMSACPRTHPPASVGRGTLRRGGIRRGEDLQENSQNATGPQETSLELLAPGEGIAPISTATSGPGRAVERRRKKGQLESTHPEDETPLPRTRKFVLNAALSKLTDEQKSSLTMECDDLRALARASPRYYCTRVLYVSERLSRGCGPARSGRGRRSSSSIHLQENITSLLLPFGASVGAAR